MWGQNLALNFVQLSLHYTTWSTFSDFSLYTLLVFHNPEKFVCVCVYTNDKIYYFSCKKNGISLLYVLCVCVFTVSISASEGELAVIPLMASVC